MTRRRTAGVANHWTTASGVRIPTYRGPRERGDLRLERIAKALREGRELTAADRGLAAMVLQYAAYDELARTDRRALSKPTVLQAERAYELMRDKRWTRKRAILSVLNDDTSERTYNRVARALDRLIYPQKKATKR